MESGCSAGETADPGCSGLFGCPLGITKWPGGEGDQRAGDLEES